MIKRSRWIVSECIPFFSPLMNEHDDTQHYDGALLRNPDIRYDPILKPYWLLSRNFVIYLNQMDIALFQPSRRLQEVMRYDKVHNNSVFWHTGESEFEKISTFERERHLIWEKSVVPYWWN